MDRYLTTVQVPNNSSELNCWKIIDRGDYVPIGFLYVGTEGMSVDWIAFADGYEWPKVNNLIDAINAIQVYLDERWMYGLLDKKTYIN